MEIGEEIENGKKARIQQKKKRKERKKKGLKIYAC